MGWLIATDFNPRCYSRKTRFWRHDCRKKQKCYSCSSITCLMMALRNKLYNPEGVEHL